ncbi:MAG TPA: MFS transporter [Candidatus Limnocylindrales bacterium]|nr:MFS transporter [Candidatus Limnocylindrales bacterium]
MRLLPTRVTEVIVPTRLGRSFRWLLGATIVNNFGDGVVVAAGPLLVFSLTDDPFLVSLSIAAGYLPVLLFGLPGGAVADRFDRKRIVVGANLIRALVLFVLVAAIITNAVSILIVLVALFALGIAETFADSASSTLIPGLVNREDLGLANARASGGGFLLMNQLVGPPVGAFLFTIGLALPFAVNAICFLLGAVLISRIVTSMPVRTGERTTIRSDLVEGVRWLMAHPPMRTLTLTILVFNVTFGAAFGVMVIYAKDHLGMGPVGFGLLTTATALGGVVGTVAYGSLERRFSLGGMLRVGLIIETLWHLTMAINTSAAIALVTMFILGIHEFVWGTTSTVVRQRAVPDEILGRVGGVYRVSIVGGIVIGTPIGGVLATLFGVTAPFWFGFVGSALLVAVMWQQFRHIAHADDAPAPALA